jgi:PAS domain S-box-containing protein
MQLTFDKDLANRSLEIIDKYIIISQTNLKGIITNVSTAFCTISGYTKDELIGVNHNIIRHPDMNPEIFKQMWNTIQNGKIWRGVIKNKTKSGGYYWVNTTIEPHFDEQGNIIEYTAIRQDITAQKEMESQHSIIVQQSKAAAMGEMISMIAHQWRQPLQAVSLLAQKIPLTKMLDGDLTDDFIEDTVNDIMKQIGYMSNTIDDFRNFFKPQKNKQKIYVSKLVENSIEFLAYMLKTDEVTMEVKSQEDFEIVTYTNEIVQVLINIIKNARDTMLERKTTNKKIVINIKKSQENCIISIEDNAGGIANNIIDKIFNPYFSTKQNKNGTGLGLYMSRMIIETHCNGTLLAENSKNGALFTITLPL